MARTVSREDPALVALELMNEPVSGCEGAEAAAWAERLKRLFAAARALRDAHDAGALRRLLGHGGRPVGARSARLPDDNLIWSFHSYAPFLLTHQGATWAGDFIPMSAGTGHRPALSADSRCRAPSRRRHRRRDRGSAKEAASRPPHGEAWTPERQGLLSYLDELLAETDTPERLAATMSAPFERVSAWAKEHGIAPDDILLGEFGMIRQEYGNDHVVPAAQRAAYYRDMIGHAERHGFTWSMWSYGGAFGVVEEFDGRRAEPDVLEMVRRGGPHRTSAAVRLIGR